MLQLAEEQQIIDSIILAAAKVGVGNLLASAFSSTLGSTVVSYEQYEHEKDKNRTALQDQQHLRPIRRQAATSAGD